MFRIRPAILLLVAFCAAMVAVPGASTANPTLEEQLNAARNLAAVKQAHVARMVLRTFGRPRQDALAAKLARIYKKQNVPAENALTYCYDQFTRKMITGEDIQILRASPGERLQRQEQFARVLQRTLPSGFFATKLTRDELTDLSRLFLAYDQYINGKEQVGKTPDTVENLLSAQRALVADLPEDSEPFPASILAEMQDLVLTAAYTSGYDVSQWTDAFTLADISVGRASGSGQPEFPSRVVHRAEAAQLWASVTPLIALAGLPGVNGQVNAAVAAYAAYDVDGSDDGHYHRPFPTGTSLAGPYYGAPPDLNTTTVPSPYDELQLGPPSTGSSTTSQRRSVAAYRIQSFRDADGLDSFTYAPDPAIYDIAPSEVSSITEDSYLDLLAQSAAAIQTIIDQEVMANRVRTATSRWTDTGGRSLDVLIKAAGRLPPAVRAGLATGVTENAAELLRFTSLVLESADPTVSQFLTSDAEGQRTDVLEAMLRAAATAEAQLRSERQRRIAAERGMPTILEEEDGNEDVDEEARSSEGETGER